MAADSELIDDLRDTFNDDTEEWSDIRKHGDRCMMAVAGDPWDPRDRAQREQNFRPCLSLDELSQYGNQVVNDFRQNKRGIKASPKGSGANDKTARFRQGYVRNVEYYSNAQQAYTQLAEDAIYRGYGALRVKSRYIGSGREQEPVIEPIVNPNMLTVDPFALRPDGADMRRATFHEQMSKREFIRSYPSAKVTDFNFDAGKMAQLTNWISPDRITVAEAWRKELKGTSKKIWLKPDHADFNEDGYSETDFKKRGYSSDDVLGERDEEEYEVKQYVTNGVEILKTASWPGKSIPFVTMYGRVFWVNRGGGTKRQIISLVSLALEPYMLYNFCRTSQMEIVGRSTKNPFMAYEGQFSNEMLEEINKSLHEPVAALFAKPFLEAFPGQLLPLPMQNNFEPPVQALEVLAEAARRAIQAAFGLSPLPTEMQKPDPKLSGRAMDKFKSSSQTGSFHYSDHYNEAIVRTGQIVDELITALLDTQREVMTRDAQDKAEPVWVNKPTGQNSQGQPDWSPEDIRTDVGEHDYTISIGPADDSERDAERDFAESLLDNQTVMQIAGPELAHKIVGETIRLHSPGPKGDAIADLFDPPEQKNGQPNPQQLQQQMQQLQGKLKQAEQMIQVGQKAIETKQIENESRERIEMAKIASSEKIADMESQRRAETAIAVAEIASKSKDAALFYEERARIGMAADATMQSEHKMAHEVGMAAMQHGQAQQQMAAQGDQQAALADQGHQQAMEQSAQGHEQTLAQGQQAADLAPEPNTGGGA